MNKLSNFQVRGVPGNVERVEINGRRIDYWSPKNPTHLLIAHDGNNVFDKKASTLGVTWKMAQKAINVFEKAGLTPPAIIGVYHSGNGPMSNGRLQDLSPQKPFQSGVKPLVQVEFALNDLSGDKYHQEIAELILPTISNEIGFEKNPERTAMIGSSMGGLSTLYGLGLRPDLFHTALAFSTHWPIGGLPLVDALIDALPKPGKHKVWMSRGNRKLDSGYGPTQSYANEKMAQLGWQSDFRYKLYRGAGHNERAWAKQIEDAFRFWMD